MLIVASDGWYDTAARTFGPPETTPAGMDMVPIAISIAEVREVREGCFLARALAFARHGCGSQQLSSRQRSLYLDLPGTGRFLRLVAANLHPSVVDAWMRRRRCVSKHTLEVAAKNALRGNASAQFQAAAEQVGRAGLLKMRKAQEVDRMRARLAQIEQSVGVVDAHS